MNVGIVGRNKTPPAEPEPEGNRGHEQRHADHQGLAQAATCESQAAQPLAPAFFRHKCPGGGLKIHAGLAWARAVLRRLVSVLRMRCRQLTSVCRLSLVKPSAISSCSSRRNAAICCSISV